MIEVFLGWDRFVEISSEASDNCYDFDSGLSYLEQWCGDRCQFFWTAQRGRSESPGKGERGFLFRFHNNGDALMFKLTWA